MTYKQDSMPSRACEQNAYPEMCGSHSHPPFFNKFKLLSQTASDALAVLVGN